MCKIRRLTEETSLWLGCSYVNRITRDCKVVTAGSTRTVQVYTTKKKKKTWTRFHFTARSMETCEIVAEKNQRPQPRQNRRQKRKHKLNQSWLLLQQRNVCRTCRHHMIEKYIFNIQQLFVLIYFNQFKYYHCCFSLAQFDYSSVFSMLKSSLSLHSSMSGLIFNNSNN